jgi:uncharacterized small protein (DUF1192 family)
MSWHEKAPGDGIPGAGATWAGSSVTEESIPVLTANPTQYDIRWMRSFTQELDERTLSTWALRLEGVNPLENRQGYLWRELARLELRRRRRSVVAL